MTRARLPLPARTVSDPRLTSGDEVVSLFIDFLCDYTDLERLEDVTKGMVNSGFRSWVKRKVWGGPDADELRVGLRKFFQYLDTHQGICAPAALATLK